MIAQQKSLTPEEIEAVLTTAAHLIRVRLVNPRPSPGRKHAVSFVLRPLYKEDGYTAKHKLEDERPPYTRLNHRLDRTVCAVCWHGHRDFFRKVYEFAPTMKFITRVATYMGFAHFEETYQKTGYDNIGSNMQPCAMADACYCEEGAE